MGDLQTEFSWQSYRKSVHDTRRTSPSQNEESMPPASGAGFSAHLRSARRFAICIGRGRCGCFNTFFTLFLFRSAVGPEGGCLFTAEVPSLSFSSQSILFDLLCYLLPSVPPCLLSCCSLVLQRCSGAGFRTSFCFISDVASFAILVSLKVPLLLVRFQLLAFLLACRK